MSAESISLRQWDGAAHLPARCQLRTALHSPTLLQAPALRPHRPFTTWCLLSSRAPAVCLSDCIFCNQLEMTVPFRGCRDSVRPINGHRVNHCSKIQRIHSPGDYTGHACMGHKRWGEGGILEFCLPHLATQTPFVRHVVYLKRVSFSFQRMTLPSYLKHSFF